MDKLPSTPPTRIRLTELVGDKEAKQGNLFTERFKDFLAGADKSQLRYGTDAEAGKVLYLKPGVLEGIRQSFLGQVHGEVTRHFKGQEALKRFLSDAMQNINHSEHIFNFSEGALDKQMELAEAILPNPRVDRSTLGVSKQQTLIHAAGLQEKIQDAIRDALKSNEAQVAGFMLDPETKGLQEVVIEIPGTGFCQLENGRWEIPETLVPPLLRQYTDKDHNFDVQATGQALLGQINQRITA